LDVQIDNLISSVEHLVDEVRQHKKIQSEKHSLGKDQANASWTSKMANPNGIAPSRADDMAQQGFETEEEEDEDVPAFVSRRPTVGNSENPIIGKSETPKIVTSNQDLLDQAKPGDTVILRFSDNVAPVLDGIKDQVRITGPVTLPVVLAEPEQVVDFLNEEDELMDGPVRDMEKVAAQGIPVEEPKFRVHGETDSKFATTWEPKHVKAVEVVREILADPNPERKFEFRGPVAGCETVVSMSPRKRLIVTEDEDLM